MAPLDHHLPAGRWMRGRPWRRTGLGHGTGIAGNQRPWGIAPAGGRSWCRTHRHDTGQDAVQGLGPRPRRRRHREGPTAEGRREPPGVEPCAVEPSGAGRDFRVRTFMLASPARSAKNPGEQRDGRDGAWSAWRNRPPPGAAARPHRPSPEGEPSPAVRFTATFTDSAPRIPGGREQEGSWTRGVPNRPRRRPPCACRIRHRRSRGACWRSGGPAEPRRAPRTEP
jgi:hypothetical protein